MDSKTFTRIISMGIKNSPETMEFLRAQAVEMLDECRINWENSCPSEDLLDDSARWDYYKLADRKFNNYMYNWLCDLVPNYYFEKNLPPSIAGMFSNIIEEAFQNIEFLDVDGIMQCVIEDDVEKRENERKTQNETLK